MMKSYRPCVRRSDVMREFSKMIGRIILYKAFGSDNPGVNASANAEIICDSDTITFILTPYDDRNEIKIQVYVGYVFVHYSYKSELIAVMSIVNGKAKLNSVSSRSTT